MGWDGWGLDCKQHQHLQPIQWDVLLRHARWCAVVWGLFSDTRCRQQTFQQSQLSGLRSSAKLLNCVRAVVATRGRYSTRVEPVFLAFHFCVLQRGFMLYFATVLQHPACFSGFLTSDLRAWSTWTLSVAFVRRFRFLCESCPEYWQVCTRTIGSFRFAGSNWIID